MNLRFLVPSLSLLACFAASARSQIVLNELLALNTKGIQDEAKQFEDWIELSNPTRAAINVSGWYLTDKLLRPTKWPIPTGTSIPAGGKLLLWCDEDQQDGPLHTNFKLSSTLGEEVWLYKPDGKTLVDHLKFGPQKADISLGRLFDAKQKDYWVSFLRPTPKAANDPGICGARGYSSFDPARHPISLASLGTPKLGTRINITLQNGVANSAFVLFLAVAPAPFEIALNARFGLLINVPILTIVVPSNGSGQAILPLAIPNDASLDKLRLYWQAGGIDATGLFGSNALELLLCK